MIDAKKVGARAEELFLAGYACSQAVLCAFVEVLGEDKLGITHKTALLISGPLGGGMGRLREVCGTFSASLMVLGLIDGFGTEEDKIVRAQKKTAVYQKVQELAKIFQSENGSIVCRKILGLDKINEFAPDDAKPQERTSEYYKKRPCASLANFAAFSLATLLNDYNLV